MSVFDPPVGPPAQELGSIPPAPPPFEDDQAPDDLAEVVPQVDEALVRSVLVGMGNMAHMIDPVTPDLWRFTDDELDQGVPPLTRFANRNDTLRRALLHGDYVVLALTFSGYMARNVQTRRHATDGQSTKAGPGVPAGRGDLDGVLDGERFAASGAARWGSTNGQGLTQ
ncbi:MAG: hypothetical protein FWC87_01155 [Acidimicrobiaceae bacterium]|nr:hypothetical protein [Acidimicrobiaceae bacterium]